MYRSTRVIGDVGVKNIFFLTMNNSTVKALDIKGVNYVILV